MPLPKLINFITINNRKEIEIEGEEPILDFTDQIIVFKKQLTFSRPPIVISKELEGRIDLVSKLQYGSEDHADLLLFFNGIPNPLMIEEGMVLVIPDLNSMQNNVVDPQTLDGGNESKKNFNKKLPKKDENRIKKIISKATGTPEDQVEIRPPNIPKDGSLAVTPTNGKIILGTNVTERCEDKLSQTQKLSEIIRQAVKDKIANIAETNP